MMTAKKKVAVGVGIVGVTGLLIVAARQAKALAPGILPLQLSDLQFLSPVAIGRTHWVTVDVYNPNDVEVTDTITMTSPWEDSKVVTISPGETKFIAAFALSFDTAGEYLIRVDGLETTVVVMAILPVIFSNLRAGPQIVTIGEDVRITVDVANPNFEETLDYTVVMSGALTGTEQVTLRPHQSVEVEFIRTVTWEGRRDVIIGDLAVAVTGEQPPIIGDPPPGSYCDTFDGHCFDTRQELKEHTVYEHLGWGPPSDSQNEGSVVNLAIGLWTVDNAIIDAERRGEDTSNLELVRGCYLWAIGNCRSDALLYLNLNSAQRSSLSSFVYNTYGMSVGDRLRMFMPGGCAVAFFSPYVRIDEMAPGFGDIIPEGGLKRYTTSWPVEQPIPEGWEIDPNVTPQPHEGAGGKWYYTIFAWLPEGLEPPYFTPEERGY